MSQSASYSPVVSKIFRSRAIILDQLSEKRGFDITDYKDFSVTEIYNLWKNDQLDMLLTNTKTGKKVFIKYHMTGKIKSNGAQIYDYIDDLFDLENVLEPEDELIIIQQYKVNDGLKSIISQVYTNDKKFINIYNLNDYLFNVLKHVDVPDHTVLSQEDKDKIKKKYYITHDKQFPEISRFDPVAQAIGLRPNEVVEIIRPSPTAITSKYYRLCY
jgi:DNA-directed RNA polymerase subunit H (RpoH/RPB5)